MLGSGGGASITTSSSSGGGQGPSSGTIVDVGLGASLEDPSSLPPNFTDGMY